MPKIKRHTIDGAKVFKQTPFRGWLSQQKRGELTYRKFIVDREDSGWTTEDFVEESKKRGVDVRWGTVLHWATGSKPRWMARQALEKAFAGIQF